MSNAVTAAEANRNFSQLLRHVRDGGSYVITSHGKAVARIVPYTARDAVQDVAKAGLIRRLRAQRGTTIGPWSRDELYEGR